MQGFPQFTLKKGVSIGNMCTKVRPILLDSHGRGYRHEWTGEGGAIGRPGDPGNGASHAIRMSRTNAVFLR